MTSSDTGRQTKELHRRIDQCMQVDQHPLRRQIKTILGLDEDDPKRVSYVQRMDASVARRADRTDRRPQPKYPEELPVVQNREDILAALAKHQLIIVCGETGSGKTTQLPKMCLEMGFGTAGFIGHTQPRRIAARSVANRIAEELGSTVGDAVGFKIRFTDKVGASTHIKLMTDGVLLAEIQTDPFLNQYDLLIIDEAHERSLNIDFLLGYLKQLLPKRADLKVIITSATIDPQRFSKHFNDAPIVFAEGRNYPVEVRYAPIQDADEELETDIPMAITEACETLISERQHDVLVFLTGERDIRETADHLRKTSAHSQRLRGVEIVPLYSRLSNAEQNRIFQNHKAPRIVLATNVAETSLTVPGIRSVVDVGLARVSRYSVRSKVQRLPIEKISQASANQRKGRCGRTAPGVCIRLYSEEDFESRPEFTEPEILRTNLSSVILQMSAMRLGSIDSFPFVEAPADKFINDGYRNLQELSALDQGRKLTSLGKRLARLPIDPRLGRILLCAADEGCVSEALTIVSALSVQDPRDRPFEKREQSDLLHAEFHDERSDFIAWLNLWSFVSVQKENLSNSKFRKMCRQRFLSALRIMEWMDVRSQLARLAKELKLPINTTESPYDNVHRALLSGLLANVAIKAERSDYMGTRNRQLRIFPGSGLFKRGPKWIMAGEIAETTQIFARQVAAIEPEWIESLAQHLLSRSYRDAHWQKKRGSVGAYEQSTLYGLIINPKKRVNYSSINPTESREIFIRDGLVAGALNTVGGFYEHNLNLLQEVETLEDKTRRRDIAVDPEMLVRFYDKLIPEGVSTTAEFETFRKQCESENPKALYFSREMMFADEEVQVDTHSFPDQLDIGNMVLPLRYQFSPGSDADGVTLVCPVDVLNRVPMATCEWLVPGMLEEKIVFLLKSLPKALRRNFVPVPDFAKACAAALDDKRDSLTGSLSRELQRMTGVSIQRSDWAGIEIPDHLLMRFEVVDVQGKTLAVGRDLDSLQARFLDQVEQSLLQFSETTIERDEVLDWDFGDLPVSVDIDRGGVQLKGYPALHKNGDKVSIKLFAVENAAEQAMAVGLCQLYKLALKDELRYLQRGLPNIDVLALRFSPFGAKSALIDDIIDASLNHTFINEQELPRTQQAYQAALATNQKLLVPTATEICQAVEQVLEEHRQVAKRMEGSISLGWVEPMKDMKDQIQSLLYVGFVSNTPMPVLRRMPLFFKAMNRRLDAIDQAPDKDRRRRSELLPVWEKFKALPATSDQSAVYNNKHNDLRWAFEELRISLFAQELGTEGKVSISRLEKRIWELQQLL